MSQHLRHLIKAFIKLENIKQSKHKSWDHEIPLQEEKVSRVELIRKIFFIEMKALREFI